MRTPTLARWASCRRSWRWRRRTGVAFATGLRTATWPSAPRMALPLCRSPRGARSEPPRRHRHLQPLCPPAKTHWKSATRAIPAPRATRRAAPRSLRPTPNRALPALSLPRKASPLTSDPSSQTPSSSNRTRSDGEAIYTLLQSRDRRQDLMLVYFLIDYSLDSLRMSTIILACFLALIFTLI